MSEEIKAAKDVFNADYFLRGKETGVSLYEDYRWLPELTIPMAKAIVSYLKIGLHDNILDFGCARGYLVRALNEIGYMSYGYDPSIWAIQNCDPTVAPFVHGNVEEVLSRRNDWIIAKDVLEHLDTDELTKTLRHMFSQAKKGVFVVVPLSPNYDEPYVVPEYEQDVTHKIRMSLPDWLKLMTRNLGASSWDVEATYRVPGVKDNYYEKYPLGNGFLTARRIQKK